ncbi:hypothetical protein [Sphingomonas sanxanigenens]|uniref:Uncharacterized protein n=1 Tax=Sphingomonas sanxanigenens DSM 19645 = NX02 TaxID=1123269 RepID=W0ADE0_9SPHN|nr:hypothetical protein [Sphingomonas sanxanigenens]AHE55919.1 hypothetical protein NX02_21435 [Sphingomonas sanxanigenens DSM 19645 = NX02]
MADIRKVQFRGLRGPGLTDEDQINLDAKVEEAAGYADTAAEQLGLVNAARADALTDINTAITDANAELDGKVTSADASVIAAAAQAEAARQAAAAIKPIGGSLRLPYDNNSQFPLQENIPGISNTGQKGWVTQAFASRTAHPLRFNVDSCFCGVVELDDRLYPDVAMRLGGMASLSPGSGLGWAWTYYSATSGSNDALRLQQRRFSFYLNSGSGANITVWSRQKPRHWRRVAAVLHRNSNVFRVDLWNLQTGEILTGTGTDNAAFLAELSVTNANINITQGATSGTLPTAFGLGAILINNALQPAAQPLTESASMMSHGLTFYAEEAVTNADLQAIFAGAHPTTVITASAIKWLRKFSLDPNSVKKDALVTGDTTVDSVLNGRYSAGSDLIPKGAGTATIDPAPRHRYIYGVKPGRKSYPVPVSGKCWPTEDSTVEVRWVDATGNVVRDWTPVATVMAPGAWQGATNKVGGTGGATGTYALGITGDGTGAAGRFTVTSGSLNTILVDSPGSGYTTMAFDFSAASGLTGASATPALSPADTSNWAGIIDTPLHREFCFKEVRLRGKSGAIGASFIDGSQSVVGYKWLLVGQSQLANGLASTGQNTQYSGIPANLTRLATNYYTANLPQYTTVEPLGLRIGADQYKALAIEMNRWADAPFEIVVAAQGGTGPGDLLENHYVAQTASGMYDQLLDLVAAGGSDYSGVLMGWHTDLTDEGGRFAQAMLEGFWLGRGPMAYAIPDHFFGRATFSGTTMTVNSVMRGTLTVGTTIRILYENGGRQTPLDTTITALGTGSGGTGTYTLSAAVTPSDPTNEVSIIGLHEQPGVDPVFSGYITGGSAATLVVTSMTSGTLQVGDRIIATSGGAQSSPLSFIKIFATGTGGVGNYTLSAGAALGSSGSPVTFKAIRGTSKRIAAVMDVVAKGTPIFYMPPTRHNSPTVVGSASDFDLTSAQPYVEGVKQGGVGAARDSGVAWAKNRGYPVGVHAIDYTQPDAYHPDNTANGKIIVGRELAITLAKCQELVKIGQPAVLAGTGKFTDGTRNKFRFQVDCPNYGRLRSGDGLGVVTPCVELSRDAGVTWSRSKHTAAVNPTSGGTLPGDIVEVTVTDALYRVAGLRYRVLSGGPFAWGVDNSPNTISAPEAEANDAAINKMLYEEIDIITGRPGLCVAPSQSIYTVADA